jgi:hypothetical protein
MLRTSLLCISALSTAAAAAELAPERVAFFEKEIRPVLIKECYQCHSAQSEKLKGGLLLDTALGTLTGGESGQPGVVPGRPEESSVYMAMTWKDEDMQMPPKKKLDDAVLAAFRQWIAEGAADPREAEVGAEPPRPGRRVIDVKEGRKHWAFQKPVAATLPEVKDKAWPLADADHFVLAALEAKGLKPAPAAEKTALLRRITFDLTGLPPTPEELDAFMADDSPDAVKHLVGKLLASERYGERWARMWLDVARFGESSGKDVNLLYPHAWRYRDYVIESFKKDKPYDQFIKEQLAGDLLKYKDRLQQAEQIVATGFLAIGPKGHNERNRRQFQMDLVDEQIDVVSQSMLGLTLACARCHDHKFDPVSQRDYYAMAGIFLSSETLYGTHTQLQNNNPSTLIELDDAAGLAPAVGKISPAEYAQLEERASTARARQEEVTREALANRQKMGADPANFFITIQAARQRASTAESDLALFRPDGSPRPLVMGVMDRPYPDNASILVRGELDQEGDPVPRGLVEVLCAEGEPRNISQGSGRLDLAFWIASKDHPLTARVLVNRVWAKLFGKGIVATPDNFGVMGTAPTHPELLDHLAVEFMADGWSIKRLIQRIMLTRTYQMSTQTLEANYAVDPDNDLLWRMAQRRVEAEAVRDSMLAVAGTLNFYPMTGSLVALAGEGREGQARLSQQMNAPLYTRSVYLPIVRDLVPEALTLFDFPDASLVSGDRDSTNVPSQSLYLMNHPQVIAAADAFARRLSEYASNTQLLMEKAFLLAYARKPTAAEVAAAQSFFRTFLSKSGIKNEQQARGAALSAFCQSLMASAEFRYLN